MQTHRKWDKMAKQRYDSEKDTNLVKPDPSKEVLTAKWVPGQRGKRVFNPFTGLIVDVEGIPAGVRVRDPKDKDLKRSFRVPAM